MSPLLFLVPGLLLGLGVALIALAFRPQHVRLADALGALADLTPEVDASAPVEPGEGLGTWLLRRRPIVASPTLLRRLHLRDRTLARHYSLKLTGAFIGFAVPLVLGAVAWVVLADPPVVPAVLSLIGAAVGFVVPDLLLRQAAADVSSDATEALLTFFDLVTLERMANQSATQSLRAAASLSDVAIFATIRSALERARLQQRPPYAELKEVGRHLELPALVDLADVMRLDETGASLAATLRARVKELRDAHLTQAKITASAVSERMTVFMVIPSLVFGLIFLVPPLLRLIVG